MGQEIEITVGGLHSDLHERLKEQIGEDYVEHLRNSVEETIHDFYRQVERAQEQRAQQVEAVADDGELPAEAETEVETGD